MARGWESKSVESQQEDRARGSAARPPVSPEERARAQRRAACELSRARIVDELAKVATGPRRSALEAALAALDAELRELAGA
jgi:hypothetical protein